MFVFDLYKRKKIYNIKRREKQTMKKKRSKAGLDAFKSKEEVPAAREPAACDEVSNS